MAEVAVVGGGIIGMFAALEATIHGHSVTLFDPWSIGSLYSSSRGFSRRIDAIGATALANAVQRESLELFQRLEMQTLATLLYPTRLLELGLPGTNSFDKVRRQVEAAHGNDFETLNGRQIRDQFFDAITAPPGWEGLLIENGHICDPEQVLRVLNDLLRSTGMYRRVPAEIHSAEYLNGQWQLNRTGTTPVGKFDAVVFASGSELKRMMQHAGVMLPLVITAQQFAQVAFPSHPLFASGNAPIIGTSDPLGGPGLGINPVPDGEGRFALLRIMDLSGGSELEAVSSISITSSMRMGVTAGAVRSFIPDLPEVQQRMIHACHYVMTPDSLPVIGSPSAGLSYVGGCSGSGFKKAPVLGREALRMALGMTPEIDLSAWSAERFQPKSEAEPSL